MNKLIFLEERDVYQYPENSPLFHPSVKYPEYPFGDACISSTDNEVYDMIRESFLGLDLDKEHFGTSEWNPLGDIIHPGDTVVIKPNMVKHCGTIPEYECTLTHPSVVRAAIDYCVIAQAGNIIVGDAPIQGADMNKIVHDLYYDKLICFYHKKGIHIKLIDFRNLIVTSVHGIIKPIVTEGNQGYTIVKLGKESKHYNQECSARYGISGYTEEKINQNHTGETHNYAISNYILQANVIINLPKPKTHRFAGITGAQKNFVGACADKEFLPHFKAGSPCAGGDETNQNNVLSKFIGNTYRKYMCACKTKRYGIAKCWYLFYRLCKMMKAPDLYTDGAWFGNDTIWRTIIDINEIILYAKQDGQLDFRKRQREILTIGDMIIGGEREGPLQPSPKPLGIILTAKNSVMFDEVFCKLTGFRETRIPIIEQSRANRRLRPENQILYSNKRDFNEVSIQNIEVPERYHFEAHPFWKEVL